ncbi:MAG TPA: 50S ribosomal protein L32 [Patescibacteria group bacterium]|nr:50S ribosomal protein L32 [Patescibacteria group bacterium]
MPQEPKRRHSKGRKGKRRASISLSAKKTVKCSNCGALILPHAVCKNCGFYKGKEVINKSKKKIKKAEDEKSA